MLWSIAFLRDYQPLSMPETNVLVLDGDSPFTAKVVRSLAAGRRWRIHVLTTCPHRRTPGIAWSRHVESFHRVEAGADEQRVAAIRTVAAQMRARVILPVIEPTALFCIRNREALQETAALAPLPSADAFSTAIDKGRLAAFMAGQPGPSIPHPPTCLPGDPTLSSLRFPVLLKPRRASGGEGFRKIESADQLTRALTSRGESANVCVQEYIEGIDMGCAVLAREGRIQAWTTQRGLHRPAPYSPYSELHVEPSAPVYAVVARLMRALNWSGIAQIDLRLDARTGQPMILEVNGRYWDSLWASTAAGVNFPDLICRMALGEPLPAIRANAGRFVQPRALPRDLLRLRPRLLRFRWNGLAMLLADPLPELVTRLGAWREALAAAVFPRPATALQPGYIKG